jgi:hypothetical protein
VHHVLIPATVGRVVHALKLGEVSLSQPLAGRDSRQVGKMQWTETGTIRLTRGGSRPISSPQVTAKNLHRPVLASCFRCRSGRDDEWAYRRKCPIWSSEPAGLDAQIPSL